MSLELFTPSPYALAAAFAIDALCGEPPPRLHPVVWIGRIAQALVDRAPADAPARELLWGACIALAVPGAAMTGALLLLWACGERMWLRVPLEALLLSTLFAVRALGEAALGLSAKLKQGVLADARWALRNLCSRDPSELSPAELSAAAIESTAENTSDSIVAPLLCYALLGLPGAAAYRAVNTLDAMIGYRGRFEYLGKISARLDDLLNLVPARLTAALLLLSGALERARVREGVRVWWRDARKTESPNAGHPMAAMAGLLGLRLEKRGSYALGDASRQAEAHDINRAWRIASRAGWIALAVSIAVSFGRQHGLG